MHKIYKIMLLFLFLLVSFTASAKETNHTKSSHPGFRWQIGEELLYKVKYSFLTVGTLRFQILKKDTLRGRPVYHCRMHMKSSGIPFVNFDDTYDSYIDEDVYSHRLETWEKEGDHILHTVYDMNYLDSTITMKMDREFEKDTVAVLDSTTHLTGKTQDGLSLLFYARANVQKKHPEDVTVFSYNVYRQTFINFTGDLDEVKINGKKLEGYYVDGKMKFVGIAGLKEGFKGWFSQEPQHVPLHAKMKVIVGRYPAAKGLTVMPGRFWV